MTPFELHVRDWDKCQRCELSQKRTRVVLCRGELPCDILFIGEAPGESENTLGRPFVGPAGKLLDSIVEQAIYDPSVFAKARELMPGLPWYAFRDYYQEQTGKDFRAVAFTNLVGCIPREENAKKASEPDGEAITACSPRIIDLVRIGTPKLIVTVGALSSKWIGEDARGMKHRIRFDPEVPTVSIVHPAAILRASWAAQGMMIQKCIVQISQAVEELNLT